jgi:hypothetical protein
MAPRVALRFANAAGAGTLPGMNDNDKAGRYLFKRDPGGHLRWLLATPALEFHAWIDSRRVVLPNQKDLTQDLVAAVRSGEVLEAFCLELEAEARADALDKRGTSGVSSHFRPARAGNVN